MTFGADNEVRYIRIDAEEEQLLGIKGDHTDLIPGVYEGSEMNALMNEDGKLEFCFGMQAVVKSGNVLRI